MRPDICEGKIHAEAALMTLVIARRASDPTALESCVVDVHARRICP
jgi:hypothetical protein